MKSSRPSLRSFGTPFSSRDFALRGFVFGICFGLGFCGSVRADSGIAGESLNLRDLLTNFLVNGITLAEPASGVDHSAHFTTAGSQQFHAFEAMNREIGSQLSSLPLASSAGGFAFEFDSTVGLFVRPTRSFGPIFSERPLTVGKGKFNIGFSVSQFTFDALDDLQLRDGDIQLVFTHEDRDGDDIFQPYWEGDAVAARMFVNVDANIQTLVATYGAGENFDLGISIPFVDVDMQASATARLERFSTDDQDLHEFPNGSDEQTFTRSGSARGLGDVIARAKYQVVEHQLAVATQFRLPTGDDRNLLGTGDLQAKFSLLASVNYDPVSPHANLGFALGNGDTSSELTADLGIDWAVDDKLTIAADLLGRIRSDADEVSVDDEEFRYNTSESGAPVIESTILPRLGVSEDQTQQQWNLALGMKLNIWGNVLLNLNGLIPVTQSGLTDNFASLIGVDYSF